MPSAPTRLTALAITEATEQATMDDWELLAQGKKDLLAGSTQALERFVDRVLGGNDDELVAEALYVCEDIPTLGLKNWRRLKEHVKSTCKDVSHAAMRALVATDSGNALTILTSCLDHENPTIRWNAVFVLTDYGQDAARALPKVRELLTDDPSPNVRWIAAGAIAEMSSDSMESSEFLAPALHDTDFKVRVYAAAEYVKGQPNDKHAVQILTEGLSSDDFYLQDEAIIGIGHLKGNGQADRCIRLLADMIPAIRRGHGNSINESLATLGKESPDTLLKLLESDSNHIVGAVASAIEKWGDEGAQHVSRLVTALDRVLSLPSTDSHDPDQDDRDYCRNSLLITLGKVVGTVDRSVLPYLLDACMNDNELVRAAGAQGLGSIGVSDDSIIGQLQLLLNDDDQAVRLQAKLSLERLR